MNAYGYGAALQATLNKDGLVNAMLVKKGWFGLPWSDGGVLYATVRCRGQPAETEDTLSSHSKGMPY